MNSEKKLWTWNEILHDIANKSGCEYFNEVPPPPPSPTNEEEEGAGGGGGIWSEYTLEIPINVEAISSKQLVDYSIFESIRRYMSSEKRCAKLNIRLRRFPPDEHIAYYDVSAYIPYVCEVSPRNCKKKNSLSLSLRNDN